MNIDAFLLFYSLLYFSFFLEETDEIGTIDQARKVHCYAFVGLFACLEVDLDKVLWVWIVFFFFFFFIADYAQVGLNYFNL